MKFIVILSWLLSLTFAAFCQFKIDAVLQKKIMTMFKADQKWRVEYAKIQSGKTAAYDEETISKNMEKIDRLNRVDAKAIIREYGYPGYTLVGIDGSDAFWAIVQHCDNDVAFQQRVLTLMSQAVIRHNATGEKLALLQDRVLTNQGHKQLYGTQVRLDLKTHHATPFPIQDSLNVDSRRKAIGLSPLRDYLRLFERQ